MSCCFSFTLTLKDDIRTRALTTFPVSPPPSTLLSQLNVHRHTPVTHRHQGQHRHHLPRSPPTPRTITRAAHIPRRHHHRRHHLLHITIATNHGPAPQACRLVSHSPPSSPSLAQRAHAPHSFNSSSATIRPDREERDLPRPNLGGAGGGLGPTDSIGRDFESLLGGRLGVLQSDSALGDQSLLDRYVSDGSV